MDPTLHELSTAELNNLFLEESNKFLVLLKENPNSEDLQLIKRKVKLIMDVLDARKDKYTHAQGNGRYGPPPSSD